MDYGIFKPVIIALIQYYYINNPAGGYCHIALDDGNLCDENLFFCQEQCQKNGDELGYLVAIVLRYFTEDEREKMYETDHWGMRKRQ